MRFLDKHMLKNKDGTPYRLNEPNPLTKNQEIWKSDLIFHNFNWSKQEMPIPKQEMPIPKQEMPIPKQEMPIPKQEIPILKQEMPILKQEIPIEQILLIYCLPAINIKHKDKLYGETYSKIEYGNKLIFEGVIIDISDMEISFWTNFEMENNSIIFPTQYKSGKKFGEFNWWKIKTREPKTGGYIYSGTISDIHPDFSD